MIVRLLDKRSRKTLKKTIEKELNINKDYGVI